MLLKKLMIHKTLPIPSDTFHHLLRKQTGFGVFNSRPYRFYPGYFPSHIVVSSPLLIVCDRSFEKVGRFVAFKQRNADENAEMKDHLIFSHFHF